MYLVLEVNAPQLPAPFPRSSTRDTSPDRSPVSYGTFTLFCAAFQQTSDQENGPTESPPHYISPALLQGIQFELCCFFSLILTASQLVSFPTGTKTLQFPAFPGHDWPIKEKTHSDISGSKPTCDSPEHFVACHVLLRRFEPSHPSSSVPKMCSSCIRFINMMCYRDSENRSINFNRITAKNLRS